MHKQTITVNDHEKFRRAITNPAPPPIPPFDIIDELVAADPILDHPPAKKGRSEIDRLMDILDTIEVESGEG
jgi:hypothetical protein